jgi:predicted secreted protein
VSVREIEVRSSGEEVEASSGDRVVVRIPENATTGYRWVVDDVPGTLELEADELIPPETGRPGAGGERCLTFAARGGGRARIELRLVRPWDGDAADRFELLVTVR